MKRPKTAAGNRIVPFSAQLLPIFREARRNNSLYVCSAADGSMMTNTAWTTSWNSYMHYLNIQAGGRDASHSNPKVVAMDRFTAHQLRHTYATMLYDAGVDVKTAQDFLGHADPTVTINIYTHLSTQKKDKAVQALQQHFSDTIPEAL
ncbi:MAG: tyrosine-type recombinase/integrase [Clostridia bacterium]|nr:tyrosine-type recombinase/integrase [Clostridia bacterium]